MALSMILYSPPSTFAAVAEAGDDRTVALSREVTLDASGSAALPGATFRWDFGDGTTPAATAVANHNYRFAGAYTATLTVTDSGGTSTDTAQVTVEMKATNLDYSKFPVDRTDYLTPGLSTSYVSLAGSDSGDGSAGNPYRTIQHALTQATPGTVILVRGGHYSTGDITVDKSDLVLAAYPGEKVVVETDQFGVWEHRNGIILSGPVEDVVIDGLEIRHFRSSGVVFGDTDTQRNVILKNLVIYGSDEGITTTYTGESPSNPFIDGLLVKNVTLERVGLIGFNAGQPAGIPLYLNVKLDNLYVLMTRTGDDTAQDAIAFENGQNVLAENCIAEGADGDGFDFKADSAAVVNSIARHITRNGVKLWSNGEIINSLVYDTGADAGVVLEDGAYRLVNSVFAWHHKRDGQESYSMTIGYDNAGFTGAEIFRSIFFEENDQFSVNGAGALSVTDNVFWNFTRRPLLEYGADHFSTAAAINAAPFGGGNVERNPGFTDPENGDFRIASGSNGFVFPELHPAPVVTVTNPVYPIAVGAGGKIQWRSDQNGSYRLEAATNAAVGSGQLLRSGTVQKGVFNTLTVPINVPGGFGRVYLFVTNSNGTGWESVKYSGLRADTFHPRTYARRGTRVRRYQKAKLYYRVYDPFSPMANVRIVIKNSRGTVVRVLYLGWKGTGALRATYFKASLPPGRYTFRVYARDQYGNDQYNVARNTLTIR